MINKFDHVRVKGKNFTGYVIDIYKDSNGKTHYLVENDKDEAIDDPDAWNDVRFPQLSCTLNSVYMSYAKTLAQRAIQCT